MNPIIEEIEITSLISAQIFWFVKKNDISKQRMIHKLLDRICPKKELTQEEIDVSNDDLFYVDIDKTLARARIYKTLTIDQEPRWVCWLVDYGIMRLVHAIYALPNHIAHLDSIARQGSLCNAVNINRTCIPNDYGGVDMICEKTLQHIPLIEEVTRNFVFMAKKIEFVPELERNGVFHGDLLLSTPSGPRQSLTKYLKDKGFIEIDAEIFRGLNEIKRDYVQNKYFNNSQTWTTPLNNDDVVFEKVFEKDENPNFPEGEFFSRSTI